MKNQPFDASVFGESMEATDFITCILQLPTEYAVIGEDFDGMIVLLLDDAAKYSENGDRIWVTATRDGKDFVIKVGDSGIGIAPEKLPRMFEGQNSC